MTDLLAQLRAQHAAATPGPWQLDHPFWWDGSRSSSLISAGDNRDAVVIEPFGAENPDLELIVNAINNLPALLNIAEAAERFLEHHTSRTAEWHDALDALSDALNQL